VPSRPAGVRAIDASRISAGIRATFSVSVHRQLLLPALDLHARHRCDVVDDAGVAHQDVDRAEGLGEARNGRGNLFLRGDVEHAGRRFGAPLAQLPGRLLHAGVAVGHGDARPRLGQDPRRDAADAARRAGDERRPAFEPTARRLPRVGCHSLALEAQ